MAKLANCPLCKSDNIAVLSGRSFNISCRDCYQVKLQCFDSKEEAIEAWNRLFNESSRPHVMVT